MVGGKVYSLGNSVQLYQGRPQLNMSTPTFKTDKSFPLSTSKIAFGMTIFRTDFWLSLIYGSYRYYLCFFFFITVLSKVIFYNLLITLFTLLTKFIHGRMTEGILLSFTSINASKKKINPSLFKMLCKFGTPNALS